MNSKKEETALLNIERNSLLLIASFCISALAIYSSYLLFKVFNPWGFIVAIPGLIFFFQSLWLLLNPFAMVYEDRFEIHQSFLQRKSRYFVDIKKISQKNKGTIYLTYNDDEIEKINLRGIKASQVGLLKDEIGKKVEESHSHRV